MFRVIEDTIRFCPGPEQVETFVVAAPASFGFVGAAVEGDAVAIGVGHYAGLGVEDALPCRLRQGDADFQAVLGHEPSDHVQLVFGADVVPGDAGQVFQRYRVQQGLLVASDDRLPYLVRQFFGFADDAHPPVIAQQAGQSRGGGRQPLGVEGERIPVIGY